jgi:FlaA1/EpsC-like NDP-sugar epimerase
MVDAEGAGGKSLPGSPASFASSWAGSSFPCCNLTAVRVPFAVLFMNALLSMAAGALPRVLLRMVGRRGSSRGRGDGRRGVIAGAGAAGELIVKELLAHPHLGLNPIGFVDDDRTKHGHRMCNLLVLGSLSQIQELVTR